MCGIAGAFSLQLNPLPDLDRHLRVMSRLQRHRGPDGEGYWSHPHGHAGFAHQRLAIIDVRTGAQPMRDAAGNAITYNGEIYNYRDLRAELGGSFQTASDTEVILRAYAHWGPDCVQRLRGMFSFAVWDEARETLFCARDRFGIKPFYYTVVDGVFYFASEIKTLLPFVPQIETNVEALQDYLTFQFCLPGKTLFAGIHELMPGHVLEVRNGNVNVSRYWDVYYHLDWDHSPQYFEEKLRFLMEDSVKHHLLSDVPVGAYLSGGLDSSIVASLASQHLDSGFMGFTGKFDLGAEYDESPYARSLADWRGFPLEEVSITAADFTEHIRKVIYHLDHPVAGPGSFPQYMVSQRVSQHRKVVLGGQGGDEIFGGYARYLVAYFEQCIKAAIDGTMNDGNFIVTYESIIPNLKALKQYKPLLQEFWSEGLFESMDRRYFRLVNRANHLQSEVRWEHFGDYTPFETFQTIFNGDNIQKESYFDRMTHFDFKTILPALLHVEDRVSMAHGVESRVPFLDHPLVEFAATIPSNVKFKDGTMKQLLKTAMKAHLPAAILARQDKMGFPVPLNDWVKHEVRDFVVEAFSSQKALSRDLIDNAQVLRNLDLDRKFGRKLWGLLSLELWQQEFHDQAHRYKSLLNEEVTV